MKRVRDNRGDVPKMERKAFPENKGASFGGNASHLLRKKSTTLGKGKARPA